MSRFLAPLSLSITLILAAMPSAQAVQVTRTDQQGAAGMCRAATTEYATRVRYRPLGVTNISTTDNVYLTCSWQGDDSQFSVRGATMVSVQAANESAAGATAVDCTLVNGQSSQGVAFVTYTGKSATIEPGGGAVLQWLPAEVADAGPTIRLPAVSCLLRPGMSIQFTTRVYNEDVGA